VKICVWEDSGKIAEAVFSLDSIRGIIALPAVCGGPAVGHSGFR
jgi:hypothetical protein